MIPTRLSEAKKYKVRFCAVGRQPMIELRRRRLMHFTRGLDKGSAWLVWRLAGTRNIDPWLARRVLPFSRDQPRRITNIFHLLHFFRRQLKAKLFFQRKHEIQMLNGIPPFDRFGRRLRHDSIHGDTEKIGCYASNLFENG
jgi:hypothetical protein